MQREESSCKVMRPDKKSKDILRCMLWQVEEGVEQSKGDDDSGAILLKTGKDDSGSGQISKWGFAPGEDDTQDLNMEYKGDFDRKAS